MSICLVVAAQKMRDASGRPQEDILAKKIVGDETSHAVPGSGTGLPRACGVGPARADNRPDTACHDALRTWFLLQRSSSAFLFCCFSPHHISQAVSTFLDVPYCLSRRGGGTLQSLVPPRSTFWAICFLNWSRTKGDISYYCHIKSSSSSLDGNLMCNHRSRENPV